MIHIPRIVVGATFAVGLLLVLAAQSGLLSSATRALLVMDLMLAATSVLVLQNAFGRSITVSMIALGVTVLYGLAVPLSSLLVGEQRYSDSIELLILSCVGVGIVSQTVGSLIVERASPSAVLRRSPEFYRRLWTLGATSAVLGVVAFFLAVLLLGGWREYLGAGYHGRVNIKREVGPIELGMYWAVGGIVAMIASRLGSQRVARIDLFFILLVIFGISLLGIRRPILYLLLPAGFAVYQFRPRSLRWLIPGAILAACLLVSFAYYRQVLAASGFGAAKDFIGENAGWSWINPANSELGAPYRVFGDILERRQFPEHLLPSYPSVIWQLIPRRILPDRPENLSEWYTNTYFSDDFIQIGGNMGFFAIAEAYLNGGLLGVAVAFLLMGALFAYLDRVMARTLSPAKYWLALLTTSFTFFLMRLDFASGAKGYLVTTLFPVVAVQALLAARSALRDHRQAPEKSRARRIRHVSPKAPCFRESAER